MTFTGRMEGPPDSCCMILISLKTVTTVLKRVPLDLLKADWLQIFNTNRFARLHVNPLKHLAVLASSHLLHDLVSVRRSINMTFSSKPFYSQVMLTLS